MAAGNMQTPRVVPIVSNTIVPLTTLMTRKEVRIKITGANGIEISPDKDFAAGTGFPIATTDAPYRDEASGNNIYARSLTGSTAVVVLEFS